MTYKDLKPQWDFYEKVFEDKLKQKEFIL